LPCRWGERGNKNHNRSKCGASEQNHSINGPRQTEQQTPSPGALLNHACLMGDQTDHQPTVSEVTKYVAVIRDSSILNLNQLKQI
jgi:hypothetical protein